MKSVKQQYIALREGNLSKPNFMRNVRAALPHLVTNITSFDDTVKILRNKGILTEADIKEGYTYNTTGKEMYSHFKEIDNVNGQELMTGITFEHEANPDRSKNEIVKMVLKNIKKNPNYYTDYKLAGKEAKAEYMYKIKPGSDQMKDVNSNDLVDKTNGMTSPKGIEKAKASSNKANKETNKMVAGVKELTHKAIRAKGVKGVMDMTGGKMKRLALKENLDLDAIANEIHDKLQQMDSYDSQDKMGLIRQYGLSGDNAKQVEFLLFQKDVDERYDGDDDNYDDNMDVYDADFPNMAEGKKHTSVVERLMKLIREELDGYSSEDVKIMVDGEEVDRSTIEVEGGAYNDYSDVYIVAAKFTSGKELSPNQIDQLIENNPELAQEIYGDSYDGTDELDYLEEMTTLAGGDNVTDVDGYMMDTSTNNDLEEVKAGTLSIGDEFTLGSSLGKFVKNDKVTVISIKPYGGQLEIKLSNGIDTDDFYIDKNDEL
jgi:hypothetical protein